MAKKKVEKEANDDRLDLIMKALGSKSEAFTADTKESITHTISSGLPDLDQMLTPIRVSEGKSGGLPRGKVMEFYGPNSGGKSSLSMRFAAQVTKNGGYVYWVDAESSFVREWAEAQGVVLKKMIIEPAGKWGEYYLEKVAEIAKSGAVDLIVLDSITVMQPYEVYMADSEVDEKKGKITDTRVGAGAKMMNRFIPKILGSASDGNCAIIFINQIRQKIGVIYGSNETTPLGEALKFAASIRLRICRVTDKEGKGIKKDGEEIGIRSQVKLVKSRMGPPEKEVIVPIYFDESVKPHPLDCLIDMALSTKTVKSRSKKQDNGDPIQTFTYEDISCIGIDEFKSELSDDHIKEIYSKIIATGHVFPDDVIAYIKEIGGDEEVSLPAEINESDPGE